MASCPAITLSPTSLPGGSVATPYSQMITASGGTAPYTFAVTVGSLPAGLGLNPSTGVLSGTPTAMGSASFTVTASDSSGADGTPGCSGSQPYTMTVGCPAITLSPTPLPNGTVATAYSQTITANGGTAPYTFSVTAGSLPPGLTLNASTGLLAGTPSATGSFSFTVTVNDGRGCTGSEPYTVVIACPVIAVSPSSLPGATLSVSYSQTLSASGGAAPYSFAVTAGSLPPGFTLNASTGVISGTPGATGSFSFTITAIDASGCTGTKAYTLVLACPTIVLSPSSLPNGSMPTAYSQTVSASGGTAPYAFAVTAGSLPPGLSLNGSTGVISGTPTTSGNFAFTVTATDANGCLGSAPYAVTILNCTLPPAWTPTASLAAARQGHTATRLLNGKVLVAGGNGSSNPSSALATCELYNVSPATWSPTGAMATTRGSHKAVLLLNGKVLVVGGLDASSTSLTSAEIYDPSAGTWSTTGSIAVGRYDHTATLLSNGKVLVAGGTTGSSPLASAQLYDPSSGTWSATGSMALGRYKHTATLLPNGKVLVTGGATSSALAISSAEIYDPTAGTWSAGNSMNSPRGGHTATLLSNGKVLVAAGIGASGLVASAEIYDPTAGTWSPTGAMATARFYHSETLLLSGKVLVAGGSGGSGFLSSAEVYDPTAGTWSSGGSMATTREFHTATRLPSGKVLVAGGWKGSLGLTGAELFDPAPCYSNPIVLTPISLPISTLAVSFSQMIMPSSEASPYTFEILEGSLPPGLTLVAETGELSGTPTEAGTFHFTVVARSVGDGEYAGSWTYSLTVVDPFEITSTPTDTPTPTPSPSPTATIFVSGRLLYYANGSPVGGVDVVGSTVPGGAPVLTVQSDSSGSYVMSGVSPGSWAVEPRRTEPMPWPQASLVRGLSSMDATWIQQSQTGTRALTAEQALAADTTGNGSVSTLDAVRIQEFRVHLRERLPVAESCGSDWAFVPVPGPQGNPTPVNPVATPCARGAISYASLSEGASGQDFEAVLYGDVTGNWTPDGGGSAEMEAIASGAGSSGPEPLDAEPESLVPLSCSGPCAVVSEAFGGAGAWIIGVDRLEDVQAFDLNLSLVDGVEVTAVKQLGLAAAAGDCSLVWAAKDATLRISLGCVTPIRGGGALLAVETRGSAGVELSRCVFDEAEASCRPAP